MSNLPEVDVVVYLSDLHADLHYDADEIWDALDNLVNFYDHNQRKYVGWISQVGAVYIRKGVENGELG